MQHITRRAAMWMAHVKNDQEKIPERIRPLYMIVDVDNELAAEDLLNGRSRQSLQKTMRAPLRSDRVQELKTPRAVDRYRRDEAETRVLEWVAKHPDTPGAIDLISEHSDDFTGGFEKADFEEAAKRLEERGLIKGISSHGMAPERPTTTMNGERCLDSRKAPADYNDGSEPSGATTINANFTGAVGGVQMGGVGNTMQVEQFNYSGAQEEIEAVLSQLRELCAEEAPDQLSNVEVLEEKVSSQQADPTLVNTLLTGIASRLGGEAAQRAVELGDQLVQLIR